MAAAGPAVKRGSVLIGIMIILCAMGIIGSTFIAWTSPSPLVGGGSSSGWNLMASFSTQVGAAGGSGFKAVISGGGVIFFTGFFSLLTGGLVLLCGVVVLIRRRPGGVLTLIFALSASVLAAVNITMVFAKMNSPYLSMKPGLGLWLFAGFALSAVALGITGLSSG